MVIKKSGERGANLTRQLLAFSRKQLLRPKVFNLNDAVKNAQTMLRRLFPDTIEIVLNLTPESLYVKVDESQMDQVIFNLALNARDAMPAGGRLTLKTYPRRADLSRVIGHSDELEPGDYIILEMADTGRGMEKETLENIFEPFYTTKEVGQGTGLGLASVYGIIKQSGGHIEVESEPGRGTLFCIFLPQVAPEAAVYKEKRDEAVSEAEKDAEAILLIEDDLSIRALLGQTLRTQGYAVLEATNGEEAIKIFHQAERPIRLVVTDVIMPELNGMETVDRLLETQPELKVIYMSGYPGESPMLPRAIRRGEIFMEKPFSPQDLSIKIQEILQLIS